MNRWTLALFAALFAWTAVLCGCKGASTGGDAKGDFDADPLALLPASAIVTAHFGARAIFDNGTVGAPVAALAARLVPLGEESGFSPARDVDRIALATYPPAGAQVAAVLSGRFDVAKIEAATKATTGAEIARGLYAGRATFTVAGPAGGVVYAVLSAKTVVAGTSDGTRRVLDRLQSGDLSRALPPWVSQTLETPGAEIAIAADLSNQPIATSIGSLSLPWLQGLRVARVIGNFEPPGMNVAATLTYGDAQETQAAAVGVRSVDTWLNVLGPLLGGIRLQNLQVTTDTANVRCKFAVDDHALLAALALAPRLLPNLQ